MPRPQFQHRKFLERWFSYSCKISLFFWFLFSWPVVYLTNARHRLSLGRTSLVTFGTWEKARDHGTTGQQVQRTEDGGQSSVVGLSNRAGRFTVQPAIPSRHAFPTGSTGGGSVVEAPLPVVSRFSCAHHRQSPAHSMPGSHRWAVAGESELAPEIIPPLCCDSTKSKSAGQFCIRSADAVFLVIVLKNIQWTLLITLGPAPRVQKQQQSAAQAPEHHYAWFGDIAEDVVGCARGCRFIPRFA